jgi:2-methylfumaryl-CoA isomerase
MRVVEASSFVAAPSCGLHLSQLGAEVIRVDTIGGGMDFRRWPLSPQSGKSLYWEGLNKGKKSVAIDLSSREGRELLTALATAPGEDGGIFLTNFPASGFLAYDRLKAHRDDLIVARVMGRADGTTALDYTVNSAIGIPMMTGPASLGDEPVNHMLPAWDLLTGAYGAFALLAAERYRRETGKGQEVRLPLDDIAIATLGHLGQIAETMTTGRDRPRGGNDLFGAFGRDFATADGRRIMVAAISAKQWSGLIGTLGLTEAVAALEQELGLSFAHDEGLRYRHRDRLNPLVAEAVGKRRHDELGTALDAAGACWGPYRTLHEALETDPAFSTQNPLLSMVDHRSGHSYPTPGAAATFTGEQRGAATTAPLLGEHTRQVLEETLGMSAKQVSELHERKIVASPGDAR